MAERQTTVNIIYKVNTADLAKLQQATAQAQAATDRLRTATGNVTTATTQAADGFKKYGLSAGSTIEGLRVRQQQLAGAISNTTKTNIAQLKLLSDEYKKVSAELKKLTQEHLKLESATKNVTASTQQLSGSGGFGSLITAVRSFIAVSLVKELVQVSIEMAKIAGNAQGVGNAFQRQIPTSTELLFNLQRATHNTVYELELMQRALQAQNFGIDVQRLPELLEFAAVRAQQTGQSVDYLVNSIVTGIGRKSILILDNLGISATRLKEEFDGASLASQNVGDVTAAVARIAQQELAKMGGYIETQATEVDQLTTAYSELGVQISKTFGDSGVVNFLKDYAESFKVLFQAINEGKTVNQVYEEQLRRQQAIISVNVFASKNLTGNQKENVKVLEDEIQRLTHSIGSWAAYRDEEEKAIKVMKERLAQSLLGDRALEKEIELRNRLINANKDDVLLDQEIVKLLQARLLALQKLNAVESERLGLVEAAREKVKNLQDQIEKAGSEQALTSLNKQLQIANGELNDLLSLGIPLNKMFSDIAKNLDDKAIYDGLVTPIKNATEAISEYVNELDIAAGSINTRLVDRIEEQINDIASGDTQIQVDVQPIIPLDAWDKLEMAFADGWRDIVSSGIMDVTDIINAGLQSEADMYDQRIQDVQDYYSRQEELAGDNEKAKDILRQQGDKKEKELRRQAFEADRKAKRQTTIINGAAAVVNAFATLPYPAAVVASILIAAQTASQLAVINKQSAKFARGKLNIQGPGNGTSDSIPAMISKGESVMTANETKKSYKVLKAVRANKLNDQIMSDIVSGRSGGHSVVNMFDDSRIVKEIQDLKRGQPDYVKQSNILYESRSYSDTYKKKTRSKSMGI